MKNIVGRISSALFILSCIACSAVSSTAEAPTAQQIAAANAAAAVPGFRPIKLGGGGFVVDLDFSPDGRTRIVRTDVHGAYIWDDRAAAWKPLINATSLPTEDRLTYGGTGIGVYAIRVAPSNSRRIYMVSPAYRAAPSHVFRSDDRGATWTRTNFAPVEMTVQSPGRMLGPKMAVDPVNPDIVILGDSAGRLHRTADGGQTWATVDLSQVPAGPEPAIAFAARSGPGATATGEVFASTGANGVYRSTDGGRSWTRTEGGPRSVARLVAGPDGLYATDRDNMSLQNGWKLVGRTWSQLPIAAPGKGNGWHSVAVNPADPSHVVLGTAAGNITSSTDGGKSWGGFYNAPAERVATDVPWLAWTPENWMTNGNMMFDPVVRGRLYFAEGIGVWHTKPPADDAQPRWISQTRGIDELIVNDLIVPPGGKPIIAVQDRGVFRSESPELFPATHGPFRDVSIRHVWAADYAATDPSYIAIIANGGATDKSAFSTDSGRTWTPFAANTPAHLPGNIGGSIAVSSPTNMVWAPANNGRPFFTRDGGRSWQLAQFPADLPVSGELGWSFSLYQNRHVFAADRVLAGTFYAYNYGPSKHLAVAGLYRSGDGGATWSKVGAGFGTPGAMGNSARLATVPGQAGHLFFAVGTARGPRPYKVPLKRSKDGGRSWQNIPQTQEVWAIGFGKAAPGKTYPTIFMAGFANGDREPAIYRSIDEAATFQKLVSYPAGNVDGIRAIAGDMTTYGRVYYGFSGSGAGYGVFSN